MFRLLAAAAPVSLALCLSTGIRPPEKPTVAKSRFAITHVSVVDVNAKRLISDQTVLIAGERIERISPARAGAIPRNAKVIDGRGLFLMPGLFDSHVHLNNPDRETRMLVANGVTFVRDMGGDPKERIEERARARSGAFYGLEIACVGTILDGDPPYHAWSRACGTPEEGRRAVREMKQAGVDQIKVYSLLKPDVHRAICAEARRLNLTVVGHVPDAMTLEQAVADGQRGIEHFSRYPSLLSTLVPAPSIVPGEFDGGMWRRYPDVDRTQLHRRLQKLATAGTVMCPTLILHAGQARILDPKTRALWNEYALPDDRRGWQEIPAQYAAYGRSQAAAFPYLRRTLVDLQNARVPLVVGTDLANPGVLAGFGVHTEMQLWQAAGLLPADILRAATLVPARFLGVASRLGTVAEGKTASLVLTRKNPLLDVQNAARIEAVFARGRYFDRVALDRLLAEAREDVLARSPAPEPTPAPFDLPGTVIARGHYDLFYEQYGDGREDFLITRVGDGYRFQVRRRQTGFGRFPVEQTGQWTAAFLPAQGIVRPQVLLPTVERYRVSQGRLQVDAVRGGKSWSKTTTKFAEDAALRSPFLSADFFLFARMKLRVGQSRTVKNILLGTADWRIGQQSVRITRVADETVQLAPDQAVTCAHYTIRPEGDANRRVDVWLDAQGVPVKQVATSGTEKRSAVLGVTPRLPIRP